MEPVTPTARSPTGVVAIIPVFEEAGAIGPTVRRLPRDIIDHVIVVDGGSHDGTVAEAEAAGAIVVREGRRGYGRACASGAERAQALGAAVAVFLDGDGSNAAERAGDIAGPVSRNEADLVLAHRSAAGREPGSMGPHQVLAGYVFGRLIGLMTGTTFRDMCAFRAIRLETLERFGMSELTYGWNLEMQVRAAHARLRIREVPLPYGRRSAGRSKVAGNLRGTLCASARLVGVLIRLYASLLRRDGVKPRSSDETRPACGLEHDHDAPSVFLPENMLREARRQRVLEVSPVPPICVLDPDGDLLDYARAFCELVGTAVAAVAEEPGRVLRGDGGEGRAERLVQRVRGPGGDAAQLGLDLGPGGLDRVQVGRVGGK